MRQDSVSTTRPCHLPHVLRRAPRGYDLWKRPLRPQLRLCLAAKPALQPRAALHEAEAGQTCACAQARPAALNDQVTAMRGRHRSRRPAPSTLLAVRPTAAPCGAVPGRYCGPVRGAAWPRLITTLAAGRSLDSLDVTARLPQLLDKVGRSLTQVSAHLPLPASGNTPGNPPAGGPGNTGVLPSPCARSGPDRF